jgi:chitin synthase
MELVLLNDMCGFCCFSMRFVVFIDLFGTLVLPATVIYLGYLIFLVATHSGQFPLIAIILLAAIYGLQIIIFILKRRWQHIGWMIVYLMAYPIYGFALPVYSFWNMDDFAWGNTRVVVGEKNGKKIIASTEDEKFDDKIIPMRRWEQHAQEKSLPPGPMMDTGDKSASVFAEEYPVPSSISMWQHGTQGTQRGSYMPPQSQIGQRYSNFGSQYAPSAVGRQSAVPHGWAPRSEMVEMDDFRQFSMVQSQINVPTRLPRGSIAMSQTGSRYGGSEVGHTYIPPPESRSNFLGDEFADFDSTLRVPDDSLAREVVRNVLKEVDINTTTTKQVRALVESKLGMGVHGPVSPEQRKALDDMIDKELEEMI